MIFKNTLKFLYFFSFTPLFLFFSIICICQMSLWPDPPPYDTFMIPWARPPPLRDVSWYVNGPLEEWAIPDAIEIGGKKARKPLKPEHFKYVSQSSCNCVKKILKKNTVIYLFEFDLKFDNFVWLTHTHIGYVVSKWHFLAVLEEVYFLSLWRLQIGDLIWP